MFTFPEGIGDVECVNVEHEEVLLVPRWIDCRRVTFKYGLGDEFIQVLETLHKLGLDRVETVNVRGVEVSPRDVVAAVLPDPAFLGEEMTGKTCAGAWVSGTGPDGNPREVYLYHVVDTEETWRRDGAQAVTWQTAINPVVALELLANGTWTGAGVLGPEAFDPVPFMDLLNDYDSPWGMTEMPPAPGPLRAALRLRSLGVEGRVKGCAETLRLGEVGVDVEGVGIRREGRMEMKIEGAQGVDAARARLPEAIEAGSLLEATPECLVVTSARRADPVREPPGRDR